MGRGRRQFRSQAACRCRICQIPALANRGCSKGRAGARGPFAASKDPADFPASTATPSSSTRNRLKDGAFILESFPVNEEANKRAAKSGASCSSHDRILHSDQRLGDRRRAVGQLAAAISRRLSRRVQRRAESEADGAERRSAGSGGRRRGFRQSDSAVVLCAAASVQGRKTARIKRCAAKPGTDQVAQGSIPGRPVWRR